MANIVVNSNNNEKQSILVSPNMSSTLPSSNDVKPRVKFNEDEIAVDMEERGKIYGTMKIDQVETPFIYYDMDEDPLVAQYKPNEAPQKVEAKALQEALGILLEQKKGNCGGAPPVDNDEDGGEKWKQADKRMEFIANRNQLYNNEADVLKNATTEITTDGGNKNNSNKNNNNNRENQEPTPVANLNLPDGWIGFRSETYDGDIYYFNVNTGISTWDLPGDDDTKYNKKTNNVDDNAQQG